MVARMADDPTGGGTGTAGGPVDFVTGAPVAGDLDVRWIHGSPPRRRRPAGPAAADPPIQTASTSAGGCSR